MRKGDKIVVTKPEWNIFNEVMEILDPSPTDEYLLTYYGQDAIIVRRTDGAELIVSSDDYRLMNMDTVFDNVGRPKKKVNPGTQWIIPKEKSNNMQRIFYSVIESTEYGVKFINDDGYTVSLSNDQFDVANKENALVYINNLQGQVIELRTIVEETLNLVVEDVKKVADKLKK